MSEMREILRNLTTLVHRHDVKLANDYQSIQRLEKDTDKLAENTGKLSITVSELAGTVKTQSRVVNAVLAVTVIAFLGMAVKTVAEASRRPDPSMMANALIKAMASSDAIVDFQKAQVVKIRPKYVVKQP